MSHSPRIAVTLLFLCAHVFADEPPRLDVSGDPLPPGALARLGTLRLRPGDNTGAFAVSPDGKTLATGEAFRVRFWELATGKEIRSVELERGYRVFSLEFTPDGKRFVAVADRQGWISRAPFEEHSIYVGDVAAGKVLFEFRDDGLRGFRGVSVSSDGRFLVARRLMTRSDSKEEGPGVILWDLVAGKEVHEFEAAWSYALAPDGKTLAIAEKDGIVAYHDLDTGKKRFQFRAHRSAAMAMAYSPDGRGLATGGGIGRHFGNPPEDAKDFTIRLWEVATGRERFCCAGLTDNVTSLWFSPDGRLLQSGIGDARVLWDLATGQRENESRWPSFSAFATNCQRLYWGSNDGFLHEREVTTGTELRRWKVSDSSPSALAVMPGGRYLLMWANGFTVWDLAQEKRLHSFRGHASEIRQILFAAHGKAIATCDENKGLWLWDVATSKPLLPASDDSPLRVHRFGFSADGRTLATVGTDAAVRVWETATGRQISTFPIGTEKTLAVWRECLNTSNFLPLDRNPDQCVVFSPGCRILAVVSEQRVIDLWDVVSGQRLRQLTDLSGLPRELVFSADGKRLAVREGGKAVRVWDVASGKQLFRIEQKNDEPGAFASATDGNLLAWSTGATVHLTDLATGKDVRALTSADGDVRSLAFTGDGTQLAAHAGEAILLWQVSTGKELLRLSGKRGWEFGEVHMLTAPDGALYAHVSMDSKHANWSLWQLATGREIVRHMGYDSPIAFTGNGCTVATSTFSVHFHATATGKELGKRKTEQRGFVTALAFSPDGRIAATGSGDGTILLWDWRKVSGVKEDAAPQRER